MKTLLNNRWLIPLFVTIVVLIAPCGVHSPVNAEVPNAESISFFKVISDKSIYEKSPNQFHVSKQTANSRVSYELYIARSPSLTLPLTEVVSITIGRQRSYGFEDGAQEAIKDMKRPGQERGASSNSPLGFVYTATIVLTGNGQKTFADFAKKYEGEHFDCRVGENSLTIAQIIPESRGASSRFVISLASKDEAQLKQIFAPIGNKVIWK
jgi:hypothetical protein